MKCLYCEGTVPMVQSLIQRGVPFCSEGHRKEYQVETQRLMLARLMDSLKRYSKDRPPRETMPAYQIRRPQQQELQRVIPIRSLVTG